MVNKAQMRSAIRIALKNVVEYGDTDIFPFPLENHVFFDKMDEVSELAAKYISEFDSYLATNPPSNVNSLVPVSYTGFRWATQIDPLWNVIYLALVLSIAKRIEDARIPKDHGVIFSYRIKINKSKGDLFDREQNWVRFMERSLDLAKTKNT